MRTTFLILCFFLLPLEVAARENYQFTFSNPTIGAPKSPYVLEYFTSLSCSICHAFEIDELPELLDLVEDGLLRIVFRDLPNDDMTSKLSVTQFCLQEYPDYLYNRAALKTDATFVASLPQLRGLASARHEGCLTSDSVTRISKHNYQSFVRSGFKGTPSFVLTEARTNRYKAWSGPTSSESVRSGITSYFVVKE